MSNLGKISGKKAPYFGAFLKPAPQPFQRVEIRHKMQRRRIRERRTSRPLEYTCTKDQESELSQQTRSQEVREHSNQSADRSQEEGVDFEFGGRSQGTGETSKASPAERSFSSCVKDLLEKGRGKYRNFAIVCPANCEKTFLPNSLNVIYRTILQALVSHGLELSKPSVSS